MNRRHPVNVGHLVMGLTLLSITAVWGLVQADVVTGSDVRWLLPLPWLLAGAAGLVAIAVGSLRTRPTVVDSRPNDTPIDTTATTTTTTTTDTTTQDEEMQ